MPSSQMTARCILTSSLKKNNRIWSGKWLKTYGLGLSCLIKLDLNRTDEKKYHFLGKKKQASYKVSFRQDSRLFFFLIKVILTPSADPLRVEVDRKNHSLKT